MNLLRCNQLSAKPDLFQAFVGSGQEGDPSRGSQAAFDALLAKAGAVGDERATHRPANR